MFRNIERKERSQLEASTFWDLFLLKLRKLDDANIFSIQLTIKFEISNYENLNKSLLQYSVE